MSTRSSVYYEDGGVHIFYDPIESEDLLLEYCQGPFVVTLPLSAKLSEIIRQGLAHSNKRVREGI